MKLQTKLISAFIVIILFIGISQALILENKIQSTFQNYLEQYNVGFMDRMKTRLELYYEETGSWENVQELYFSTSTGLMGQGNGMMRGMSGNGMTMALSNADLVLLDKNGMVIADTAGTRIGENNSGLSGKKQDIIIDGKRKGTLILYQKAWQNLEKEFLRSANLAVMISSMIASIMAVLFAFWIAKRITIPLKSLVRGAKRTAEGGKWETVSINTKDEFHELGEAFNDMAQKLAKNEEVRQTLVADVAHELRTPLAILQGKLESIQEGAIESSEKVVLELTDEVYRLNRLVSDLQQLSLAEAGQLPLHLKPVHIKDLVERICSNLQWNADEKEITLLFDSIPADCLLELDPDRITQVIVNLVGNALRHAPEAGIVEVSLQKEADAIYLRVSDNGPGIPEDILPFIFDRFYKHDRSRSRNSGGTGLGLSIAKGFVEAHGGTLTVKSEINKGTVFTVSLLKK
ncbi:sensor histidine kinase [Bacillus benzoevorans]|uniref:histidine kinase n=1 Tax=Bacillus benzoevorans TaxID=1456 RepID=A0A7X0LVV5_9BACI|nr:ATP-binding protein [Bacillus benzoevorans]MBB6444957.1 two-component system sensor histidine kinase BaeS [Bacillus benzoevorans]